MRLLRWIWKVTRQVAENDLQNHAAEMAYFAMMAVFPFFLLLTTAVAFLPIPDLFGETMILLQKIAPEEVIRLLEETIFEVTTIKKTNLLSATLIVCVWMSSGAMSSTTRGLNKAFGLKDPRHYARFFGLSLLMTFMLGMLLVIGIVVILLGPRIEEFVFNYVNLGGIGESAFKIVRNLIPLFFLFVVHAGIYWLCPAMKKKFRIFSPGTLFSVTSWIVVSVGFKLYLDQVNNYDKLYGSLGAVILCLVWFYMMSFVLLIGGQIDAVLHPEYKANLSDATVAPKEPLPWKLVAISVAILILVPLGISKFLTPASFTPIAQDVGGEISDLLRRSLRSGSQHYNQSKLTAFLKNHVDENGLVEFAAVAQDIETLDSYIADIAKVKIETLTPSDLQALLINLYNASALRLVAVQEKGLRSIRDIEDAYDQNVATLAGHEVSLHDIRDRILRVHFGDDPRQLCALSNMSLTAPKLQRYALEGMTIDQQLNDICRELLHPPFTTVKGNTITLPWVFVKFRPSFEGAAKDKKLETFIRPFVNEECAQVIDSDEGAILEFRPANHHLNRRP